MEDRLRIGDDGIGRRRILHPAGATTDLDQADANEALESRFKSAPCAITSIACGCLDRTVIEMMPELSQFAQFLP